MSPLQKGALVIYKSGPALVNSISDKIEIKTHNGAIKRVRDKDILLITAGPVTDFKFLDNLPVAAKDVLEETCELSAGETLHLPELAELLFGETTTSSIWSAYLVLVDDIYFTGNVDAITPRDIDEARRLQSENQEKLRQKQLEYEFIKRLKAATLTKDDFHRIIDIKELALGKRTASINLKNAGYKQDIASAHEYLVKTGYWDKYYNPYPARMGLVTQRGEIDIPAQAKLKRIDLTELDCFAIDAADSTDPDDAISIDGDKFWVHIADVASLVENNSPLENYAREQPANIYLPEGTVYMLPREVTNMLGLGLNTPSSALSICFVIENDKLVLRELALSRINVTRLSYTEVEKNLTQEPFAALSKQAEAFKKLRLNNNAVMLKLPAVTVKVANDVVRIEKLELYKSRDVVMEFMLMAGAAVAEKMLEEDIPFIYSTQNPPDSDAEQRLQADNYADMLALRNRMSKSQATTDSGEHFGLGLKLYSQLTSPLRRYADLCNHQQLHAYLMKKPLLSKDELEHKIATYKELSRKTRRCEQKSNLHWKIVYLSQNPGWRGEGIIVANTDYKSRILIPELSLETTIRIEQANELNRKLNLELAATDIYELDAKFRICN